EDTSQYWPDLVMGFSATGLCAAGSSTRQKHIRVSCPPCFCYSSRFSASQIAILNQDKGAPHGACLLVRRGRALGEIPRPHFLPVTSAQLPANCCGEADDGPHNDEIGRASCRERV